MGGPMAAPHHRAPISPPTLLLVAVLAAGCGGDSAIGPAESGLETGAIQAHGWRFTEVAEKAGLRWRHHAFNPGGALDAYDHGNGVAAGDFDGDGHADVILLTQCGRAGYFLGRGDGTFEDRSDRLAMLDDGVRVGIACGDFDEDGRVDLYVTFVRRPNALLRQNADGTFTDVAAEKGVALVGHWSGAAFADLEGDGDLDLVVAGNMQYTEPDMPQPATDGCAAGWKGKSAWDLFHIAGSDPTALLVNGGPGAGFAFTEEAAARGIPLGGPLPEDARGFGDVLVLDYDRDGSPDLFLPEMFHGRSALLQNDGTGSFIDVTAARIPRSSYGTSNAAADDFDGDGWPDLFMTDMHSDMWAPTTLPFEEIDAGVRHLNDHGPHSGVGDNPAGPLFGNSLWMSEGAGAFAESGPAWGAETFNPWGVLADDFDNDGRVDAFIPSGMSNPYPYYPDVLLRNAGNRFEQVQDGLGLAVPPGQQAYGGILVGGYPLVRSTRGCATADFDEDGDLDIVGFAWGWRAVLWRNDLPRGTHWIGIDLRGAAPRDPYGAEVRVEAGGKTLVRWMRSSRGYLSQSDRTIHVGLGATGAVDAVTVRWPDGTSSRVEHPAADRVLVISE
jgi:hypothetical protein